MSRHINIAVLGDKGSGKTSFIIRCMTDHFDSEYISTTDVCVSTYFVNRYHVNFWEIPYNAEKRKELYLQKVDAAIILCSQDTDWVLFLKKNFRRCPYIVCSWNCDRCRNKYSAKSGENIRNIVKELIAQML